MGVAGAAGGGVQQAGLPVVRAHYLPAAPADRPLRAPDAVDDPGLSAGSEVADDLGEGAEQEAGRDGAAACCEQGPHFADRPGDGGAVDAEPAGQHVVGGTVAKVDECGQEAVDEDQPVLCAGADGPIPWLGVQSRLVPFVS